MGATAPVLSTIFARFQASHLVSNCRHRGESRDHSHHECTGLWKKELPSDERYFAIDKLGYGITPSVRSCRGVI